LRANLGAAIVSAGLMLATAAHAQSVWGGPGSTTATQNYKLGTNWGPNGAPVAAGQSAIFDTTGKPTINVNAGAIAPDSWTFNANSQSYTVTSAAVNFSATGGLFNNANAGQTISIDNNLGESAAGAKLQQLGNSTLILTGNNTYSGGTVIAAGTLQIGNGGTSGKISGDVLDLGVLAFNRSNNVTFDGGILGNGQVNQIGTGTLILGGANTYSGGTLITNGGTLRANNSTPGTSSSVGTGTVTLDNGQFQAGAANLIFSNNFTLNNSFSAGSAVDNNGKTLTLSGIIADGTDDINGRFGSVTFVGTGKTILTGNSTYTGGTFICNCATVQLGDATHTASIVGKITNEGQLRILNADTAGITSIVNTGMTGFFNTTSASTATILNSALLQFANQSTAGEAMIRNTGGTGFLNHSMAGTATIINRNSGLVAFADNSTADHATIRNIGGEIKFLNHGTAGNATIINRAGGLISFANNSTAGDATITTRQFAQTFFDDHSNGDNARFITNGTGLVDFSGTTGAGGLHQITAGSIEGSGNYFIGNGNTLGVGSNNLSTEVSGVIADFSCGCSPGPGALQKAGTGTLTLSGANTYSGGTIVTAGTLQLGNGGATGSIAGDVVNNAALAFNRSNAYQFVGAISGSGAVQQDGAGTTTLTAVNTYAGATIINAGTLALSGAGSIASSIGVIDNGTFDISATTAGASIKNLSGAGIVTLGSQTLTLSNASGTFAGAIGGSGGLIKQGTGLFELSGANTYTGSATVAAGNLRVNGSVASAVTVQSGATLSGTGSVGGLVTVQSGGTLSAGQSPGTLTLGALNLNAGSASVFELGSPGVVGGPTNDLVNVIGNLTLGGTLSVNAPSAGYYRLFNYGTLTPSNFATVTGSSNGTPIVLTNVPNQVNLSIAAAGQRIQFWDGADQTGNGVVNGGTGTWNATNTNWTGAPGQATFNDQWRSSVGVFTGAAGTVTVAGTQAFDTLQFSTTGYVLNAGAGGQLQLAGLSGNGTINTDNGVVATISAAIVNGSSQSLTKVGGGTLVLTGDNTYTGTTISGGTLQVGNGGTTGSIVGNVTNNGKISFYRDFYNFAGSISGNGSMQVLGGFVGLTGDNTFSGGTTITSGVLAVGGLGAGGTTGSLTGNVVTGPNSIGSPNQLWFTRTDNSTFAGSISGPGLIAKFGGGTLTLTGANSAGGTVIWDGVVQIGNGGTSGSLAGNVSFLGTTSRLRFNRSDTLLVSDFIGSGGFVEQAGSGIVVLTGMINGSPVSISAGTLQIGDGGTTGLVAGNIANNGLLAFNRSNALIFDGVISGTGATNQIGAGTTTLTADNNYSGGTTISSGTLQLGNGGATGSIVGNVLDNGVLTVNRSNAIVLGGVISGTGSFNQIGTGTTTLTNINTYTGPTTVTAGALNISAAGSITSNVTNNATFTNVGNVTGSLTNTGTANNSGTITNGLTNTATVNAHGGAINGAIANNSGGTFNVLGTVTSNSTFNNAAAATLAVGGSGAYTLQGLLTNSGMVTVASGGQLTATVGGIVNNAGGSITVALGGTLKDDLNNAGIVANNGAYLANVATNTGTVTNSGVWTGNVASNAGTINNNLTWTGTVSNAGTFNNAPGATVSGVLANASGTAANNGALNGGASVSGGIFTGSGTVANLTVSGGIFAPGNGTPGSFMTVSGNLAFQSGALYLVQLNPTTSTFTRVNGIASLSGGAGAGLLAGNYLAKQYIILTAAGGVNGSFASFNTLGVPSGFQTSLSYDPNNVFLNLDFVVAKYPGLNANQQNVANALANSFNTTGGISAVFGALTPGGLAQASGELATRTQQTTFEAMHLFLGLLTDPFVAGRWDGAAPPARASQFAEANDANAYASIRKPRTASEREAYAAIYRKASIRDTYDPRWSVWAAGYGGSQTTDGNVVLGSNNARSSIGGVAVGADYRFSPNTLAGFAVSGGGTGFSVANSGSGRSDLFQAGAFVRHNVGAAYLTGALAYGWQDITTDRAVTIAGADLLRAQFNANAFSGRAEGGYRFAMPWIGGIGLTPYAAGQFVTFDLPAYAEQAIAGANTFALSYTSKSMTDTRSELGIRTDKSFAMQNGILTLRGRAAWAHDFNPDRNIAATFQTLPGASFVVNGAGQARDAALVTGSAEMKWLNGFSLAGTFEGEFSSVTRSYAGKGVVRYVW
jgi:autotransporter-associated beta strand protein